MTARTTPIPRCVLPSDREFELARFFATDRAMLFAAWTHETHLEHWWAPPGSTLLCCASYLVPGGRFRRLLRSRNGDARSSHGVYDEIEPHHRLVHTLSEDGGPLSVVSVRFSDVRGGTLVTQLHWHASRCDRDRRLQDGVAREIEDAIARLEAYLSEISPPGMDRITREPLGTQNSIEDLLKDDAHAQ